MKHGVLSLICAWNITTMEINSGVYFYLLKVKSAKCLCLLPTGSKKVFIVILVLVLVLRIWSCSHHWIRSIASDSPATYGALQMCFD